MKYRFLNDEEAGLSAAIFPACILPTASHSPGEKARLLLPLWVGKDFAGGTSLFGGGGYVINPGAGNRDFWQAAIAVTHDVNDAFSVGAEITRQGPDMPAARRRHVPAWARSSNVRAFQPALSRRPDLGRPSDRLSFLRGAWPELLRAHFGAGVEEACDVAGVASPTCRSGIAVPGATCCGSRIQYCMFGGVLARWPPMITRSATPSRGGPTIPVAVRRSPAHGNCRSRIG